VKRYCGCNLWRKPKPAITGSVVIKESNNYYNRMLSVFPSGEIQHYDKRHLFTPVRIKCIQRNPKAIIDYLGWKICPCYDFAIPVFLEIQMITICLSM
jgi:predicted amidohydrolase